MGLSDTLRSMAGALVKAETGDDGEPKPSSSAVSADEYPAAIAEMAANDPQSLFWDPFAVVDSLGYKDKPADMTFDVLRSIPQRVPIIQACIKTRVDQVSNFGNPQEDKFSVGFRVQLRDRKASPSKASEKHSQQVANWLLTTGKVNERQTSRGRDTFETFLKKIVRDSLTFDQTCFEVREDRKGLPYDFYAVDASTIRISDTTKLAYSGNRDEVRYAQVYDGLVNAQYTADQLCFGVRNPVTDIRNQGYGYAESEMLVRTITALLWAHDYNMKFFCADGDALVTTAKGLRPLRELAGRDFIASTGPGKRCEARAFSTGMRPVAITTLWNGLELETSPEHRFRVIPEKSETGTPEWSRQEDLKAGDFALVSYERSDPLDFNYNALHVGKKYPTDRKTGHDFEVTQALVEDSEFWEMMGFALGDGYFPDEGRDTPSWVQLYPHYEKDKALFAKFFDVCARHKIHATARDVNKHVQRADGGMGYPAIQICHVAFHRWLRDIGFKPSREGKRIPTALYQQPAYVRDALLRGLFSADGHTTTHATGYRTPTVHSSSPALCQDILRCLFSVGVAANIVGGGEAGDRHGGITVQDIGSFVESVGYLQEYKNESITRSEAQRNRWDRLHPALGMKIAKMAREHEKFPQLTVQERGMACKASRGKVRLSRAYALHLLQRLGEPEPSFLRFLQVPIEVVGGISGEREMFDVEVFNDEHLFVANHMAVHNSQGTSSKGIINFKGPMPPAQLRSFRRQWYSMAAGIENAFKTPIINAPEGLEYQDLMQSNRDMEFNAWFDFLIKVVTGIFGMDPMEINFKYGDAGSSAMFESSNKQKLANSKDKGLTPLLRFIARRISDYLVTPLDEDFEFAFVGLEAQTPQELAELNAKQIQSYKTVNEARAEEDLDPLDGGDIVLNPVFIQAQGQAQQAEAMAGQGDDFGAELDGYQAASEDDEDEDDPDAAVPAKPAKAFPFQKSMAQQNNQVTIEVEI